MSTGDHGGLDESWTAEEEAAWSAGIVARDRLLDDPRLDDRHPEACGPDLPAAWWAAELGRADF
jgi:hypothetical protein